ncbi:hypothetical protein ACFW31_23220 [Nocardiopsis alba]|uniref:hypothetical protein n=1 Tax=Nocardiopsis alba TaxID=53437 RepID=UPI00366DD82D
MKNKPKTRKLILLTGCLFLAPLVVVFVSFSLISDKEVHFTSSAQEQVPPPPQEIDHIAWEWDPPEDQQTNSVMPGLMGPIAVSGRGVTGLDGTTGEELWGYLSALESSDFSASVTPDGQHAVIAETRGSLLGERTHISLLDTMTGEVQDRYSYSPESPYTNLLNLSDHNWLEVRDDGFVARDLNNGGIAWEYQPDPGCYIQSINGMESFQNYAEYSIAASGDHYFLTQICDSHSGELMNDYYQIGDLISLDAISGEIAWSSKDAILFDKVRIDLEDDYISKVNISRDESSILAHTTSGFTIFEIESGKVIQEEARDFNSKSDLSDSLFDFSSKYASIHERERGTYHLPSFSKFDLENGEAIYQIQENDEYTANFGLGYERINTSTSSSRALSLDGGVVMAGCTDECIEDRSDDAVLFVPWDEQDSEPIVISEKIGWISDKDGALFLEAPGSVILYQTGPGGSIIGLA